MKNKLTGFVAATVLVVIVVVLISWPGKPPRSDSVDTTKLLAATQTYVQRLKAQGAVVPSAVSLKELIAQGLLQPEDVRAFAGLEVTLALHTNEIGPQDVLARARLPDGSEIVALGDGSVQSRK